MKILFLIITTSSLLMCRSNVKTDVPAKQLPIKDYVKTSNKQIENDLCLIFKERGYPCNYTESYDDYSSLNEEYTIEDIELCEAFHLIQGYKFDNDVVISEKINLQSLKNNQFVTSNFKLFAVYNDKSLEKILCEFQFDGGITFVRLYKEEVNDVKIKVIYSPD